MSPETVFSKLGTVLIPTDGSEFSEGAVREGIRLAKNYGAKVIAVFSIEFNPELEAMAPNYIEKVEAEATGILKAVQERASKDGVSCSTVLKRGIRTYEEITDEARAAKADAIVMGRRGRTGIKRLLMGSVTAKVIGHSPCDVLVVPRAAKLECRHVLVATDGSKNSLDAASEAVAIAKRCGSKLTVVSAVSGESSAFVQSEMQKGMVADTEMKEAQKNVAFVKDLASKAGVAADGLISSGRPYDVIVETAREKNADLIVVGSHGRTGLGRLLMGSVTERVIGHADCAVLVVTEKK